MVNAELKILYINALPQYTGILTKFVWVPQKVISNNVFTTNECHLTMRVDTTLSKYVKRKLEIMSSLKWYIIKSVPAYLNISRKCQLSLQEKFEILN